MTVDQAVRPIKDNADGSLTICADCKHYTYSANAGFARLGLEPDTCMAAPDKINFINGRLSYRPCVEVNTDGHCPLFERKPPPEHEQPYKSEDQDPELGRMAYRASKSRPIGDRIRVALDILFP